MARGAAAGLLVLAAGAACCAAAAARRESLRFTLRLPALGAACATLGLGSVAGRAAALGVLLCSLTAARARRRLPGLALAAGLVVGISWAVAEDVLPDGLTISRQGRLTRDRVRLWPDAAHLDGQHPVRGIGPGRFAELSPTGTESLRSEGKPHSAPLQQAAEQGLVGVLLLGPRSAGCCTCCGARRAAPRWLLTAGAALTALAAPACAGNAVGFTPVTAGAGLLAGPASARRPIGDGGPAPPPGRSGCRGAGTVPEAQTGASARWVRLRPGRPWPAGAAAHG